MMRKYFDYKYEVDEFVERLVDNGHYGDILFRYDPSERIWIVEW